MTAQLGLFQTYPDSPGWKAQDTSRDAAQAVDGRADTLRRRIMAVLMLNRKAYTADEIAELLNESPLSIRPRFSELYAQGAIWDTGVRRQNSSGHKAICWSAIK